MRCTAVRSDRGGGRISARAARSGPVFVGAWRHSVSLRSLMSQPSKIAACGTRVRVRVKDRTSRFDTRCLLDRKTGFGLDLTHAYSWRATNSMTRCRCLNCVLRFPRYSRCPRYRYSSHPYSHPHHYPRRRPGGAAPFAPPRIPSP